MLTMRPKTYLFLWLLWATMVVISLVEPRGDFAIFTMVSTAVFIQIYGFDEAHGLLYTIDWIGRKYPELQ